MRARNFVWVGAVLAACLSVAWSEPARVVSVSPSGARVPENLLRFSVRFDVPPEGGVLGRLALVDRDGKPLREAFLEQELWSPDGRTLTVLLHPGRVKTGLAAREQWGAILTVGDQVLLTFDGRAIQRWSVGPKDEQGPAPAAWTISPLRAAHCDPLVVHLDAPIDALDVDYVAVVDSRDRRVRGHAAITDRETVWRFRPEKSWRPGRYKLIVRGTLEDPSGNRVNGQFESGADKRLPLPSDVEIPFVVGCGLAPYCR